MIRAYVLETKTTSEDISPGSAFWKRTTLDPQLSVYIPAIRTMGYDPLGAVYDALRKPAQQPSGVPILDGDGVKIVVDASGQRVRTKDDKKWRQTASAEEGFTLQTRPETADEFYERCLAAIAEAPEKYYARTKIVRLEEDEREAATDVWSTASQMRESRKLKIYPRNPDSCMSWSRACDYLNVCCRVSDINDPILFQNTEPHAELDDPIIEDDRELLTQSSMRAYRSCQRKFFYRYVSRQRPILKAQTLRMGSSVHEGLDVFRRTGGDLAAAVAALTNEDPYDRAKERAMLIGYAARWGEPKGFVAVEKQFEIALFNPATGAASRTYKLGGKIDAIIEEEHAHAF